MMSVVVQFKQSKKSAIDRDDLFYEIKLGLSSSKDLYQNDDFGVTL
jgi:hypothetical protein